MLGARCCQPSVGSVRLQQAVCICTNRTTLRGCRMPCSSFGFFVFFCSPHGAAARTCRFVPPTILCCTIHNTCDGYLFVVIPSVFCPLQVFQKSLSTRVSAARQRTLRTLLGGATVACIYRSFICISACKVANTVLVVSCVLCLLARTYQ